jgi:hypothetical protein
VHLTTECWIETAAQDNTADATSSRLLLETSPISSSAVKPSRLRNSAPHPTKTYELEPTPQPGALFCHCMPVLGPPLTCKHGVCILSTHQLHLDHLELLLSLTPPRMLSLQHSTGHTSTGAFDTRISYGCGRGVLPADMPRGGCKSLPAGQEQLHFCTTAPTAVLLQ